MRLLKIPFHVYKFASPKRQPQWHHCDETVLNDSSKQLRRNVQLLLGVLGKVLVLFKQVLDHAGEDVALPLDGRRLETLQELEDLVDGERGVRRVVVDLRRLSSQI